MFNFFKKEEPISQDIIDYYHKYKEVINSDSLGIFGRREIDYLTDKNSTKERRYKEKREIILHNVRLKLKKIASLKTRYPYLAHYILEEYIPTGSMDHALTFCTDEEYEIINTREMAIYLASMGVKKYIPHTYLSDLEMLLIVILNKGFYGAACHLEPLAYSLDFIHEDYWRGEYCSDDPIEMSKEEEFIHKIYEIVLFEKPIREVYDQIRECLLNIDKNLKETFLKHRQQVEEILSNESKAKVFMRYFNHDGHDIKKLNKLIKL